MNGNSVKIVLGDEYDSSLKDFVIAALIARGAVAIDVSWGVGGSQELEISLFRLSDDLITIESETFIGFSIIGPRSVVSDIQDEVRRFLKQ